MNKLPKIQIAPIVLCEENIPAVAFSFLFFCFSVFDDGISSCSALAASKSALSAGGPEAIRSNLDPHINEKRLNTTVS